MKSAIVRHEYVGIMAQRVVEGGFAPRIHCAIRTMGAVEDFVDVMRCVTDILKCARTIKPKLVASFASVSTCAKTPSWKSTGPAGGEETPNGNIHCAVVISATPTRIASGHEIRISVSTDSY